MPERINLGKVLVTLEGEHDSTRSYDKYCEVTSGGSSFVSKKDVPIGTPITDTTYWQIRASKGADGTNGVDGNDGEDAYQPFKGWYSSTSELNTSFGTPQVGDYAYIKGASAGDPVAIYQCATAGTWTDSGRTFNPANNQEFASGESLNNVQIVNNLNGGSSNVLSAEQGKVLDQKVSALGPKIDNLDAVLNGVEVVVEEETKNVSSCASSYLWLTSERVIPSQNASTYYSEYKRVPVTGYNKIKLTANDNLDLRYLFLKADLTDYASSGWNTFKNQYMANDPNMPSSMPYYQTLTAGNSIELTIPTDATHILVRTMDDSTNTYLPTIVCCSTVYNNGVVSDLESVEAQVSGLNQNVSGFSAEFISMRKKIGGARSETLTYSDAVQNYYINQSTSVGRLIGISSLSGYCYIKTPINVGDVCKVHAYGTGDTACWMLTDELGIILSKSSADLDTLDDGVTLNIETKGFLYAGCRQSTTYSSKFKVQITGQYSGDYADVLSKVNKTGIIGGIETIDASSYCDSSSYGRYRMPSGSIGTNPDTKFFVTNPILINKGDIVTLSINNSGSAQSIIQQLAIVDVNGKYVGTGLSGITERGVYTYTAIESCYMSLSLYNAQSFGSCYIKRVNIAEQMTAYQNKADKEIAKINALDDVRFPSLTTNPIERIDFNCGLIGIFKSIGIIGDSLASGEMQGWDSNGNVKRTDMYEYSWGQQIAKMTGIDVFNFSQGGQSARGWINGTTERTWGDGETVGASVNPKQCYFIGLAHNDSTLINNNTYTGGIGTTDDIDTSDPDSNGDSYVGQYARIIQKLKTIEPRCYVFCITAPNSNYSSLNAKVRDIVEYLGGSNARIFLIDLEVYGARTSALYSLGDHLSSAGYLYHAYEICNYVTWVIRNNPSVFKYASLVGSNIYDTNPT